MGAAARTSGRQPAAAAAPHQRGAGGPAHPRGTRGALRGGGRGEGGCAPVLGADARSAAAPEASLGASRTGHAHARTLRFHPIHGRPRALAHRAPRCSHARATRARGARAAPPAATHAPRATRATRPRTPRRARPGRAQPEPPRKSLVDRSFSTHQSDHSARRHVSSQTCHARAAWATRASSLEPPHHSHRGRGVNSRRASSLPRSGSGTRPLGDTPHLPATGEAGGAPAEEQEPGESAAPTLGSTRGARRAAHWARWWREGPRTRGSSVARGRAGTASNAAARAGRGARASARTRAAAGWARASELGPLDRVQTRVAVLGTRLVVSPASARLRGGVQPPRGRPRSARARLGRREGGQAR